MKTLLVGLGQIGLGLVVPVFKKAGYTIVGTDANPDRLNALRNGYFLETPSGVTKVEVDIVGMGEVSDKFDIVVTSVGRQHLEKVATWCRERNISAPVLLAENLPDPLNFSK
jgi:UDP-N-acetyl-D-mannosaminuronate dehydrogenase